MSKTLINDFISLQPADLDAGQIFSGKPADAYTRKARRTVHALFDPLWRDAPAMYGADCPLKPAALRRIARSRTYMWLSHHMGMSHTDCHISMMDVEQLRSAWRTITNHKPTPESIRAWAKESDNA